MECTVKWYVKGFGLPQIFFINKSLSILNI